MIYDTLFAMDENFNIQPQMVKGYSVNDDKLTYTFTLRDGLKFHDGAPVTSADCIASIQRWGKRDGMGQKLMDFTKELTAIHDKTFKLVLKEPYGLVLVRLASRRRMFPSSCRSAWPIRRPTRTCRKRSAWVHSALLRRNSSRV
jgi:ABC-type transport system substrate-binding protein